MEKWRISWPRPSDIVHQKVMILITFHRQSLMNPCAKFQKDRTKALGGVRSNATPGNEPKNLKSPNVTKIGRRTVHCSPVHQETFLCVWACYILPPSPVHVGETVARGTSKNADVGGAVEAYAYVHV